MFNLRGRASTQPCVEKLMDQKGGIQTQRRTKWVGWGESLRGRGVGRLEWKSFLVSLLSVGCKCCQSFSP